MRPPPLKCAKDNLRYRGAVDALRIIQPVERIVIEVLRATDVGEVVQCGDVARWIIGNTYARHPP